jgi:electron transfer flavoprotein beta subunit
MKIVVCVKQVPGAAAVKIDPETRRLVREGVAAILNPFDYHALEEAVRIREAVGGEIHVLTMGPSRAEEVLRESLAFGADHAVLLCDRKFAGSDTWATSYALALAIKKIGAVDLVLCGRQAIDGDTAQVGPGIAGHLGWPQACGVASVSLENDRAILVSRMMDDGYDRCRIRLPAVLATVRELNEPRVPRLAGWIRALERPVTTWNAADLGADVAFLGLNGSPTRVISTSPAGMRSGETRLIDRTPVESATEILRELRLMGAM